VRFTFDARSHTKENLNRVPVELRRRAKKSAAGATSNSPSSLSLAPRRPTRPRRYGGDLSAGTEVLGINPLELPSGPGHDAGDFSDTGVPATMIFVHNRHGSHNPRENMPIDAFVEGSRLLLWLLLKPP
jgi:N-carbamoyl-L-amino-acid hydrolase